MSDETTVRLGLPFLAAGQAQKELSHNEALTLLDMTVQPVVVAVGANAPPATPVAGQCWIVGAAPTAAWTGRANAIAGWTAGGWRFLEARAGMAAWSTGDAALARFSGSAWVIGVVQGTQLILGGDQVVGSRGPAITTPSSGAVIDVEGRAALGSILSALRSHGLIAT